MTALKCLWESVGYVRDAGAQGRHNAMIVLGHEVSEEPRMQKCADQFALDDPIYRENLAFRFRQQHHSRVPTARRTDRSRWTLSPPHSSGLSAGKRYTDVFNSFVATNPGTTLAELSLERSEKLGGRTVRVVEIPNLCSTPRTRPRGEPIRAFSELTGRSP